MVPPFLRRRPARSMRIPDTSSRAEHSGTPTGLRRAAAAIYGATALVVGYAIVAAPPSFPIRYFVDKELVNIYSAGLLFTCALIAAANLAIAHGTSRAGLEDRNQAAFWALACVGMVYVTTD